MKSKQIELSVIVPAFNEEKLLEKMVSELHRNLQTEGISEEILIVENGSKDKTAQIARQLSDQISSVQVLSLPRPNYGEALKEGINNSNGDLITIVNVDFWDVDFIRKSILLIKKNEADFVIGSKHLSKTGDSRNLTKRLISQSFNLILRILFGFKGTDTHGLKTFKRGKIKQIVDSSVTTDFVFDTELVLRASNQGLKIVELPVIVKEVRPRVYSNLNQISKTIKNIAVLYFAIKINKNRTKE